MTDHEAKARSIVEKFSENVHESLMGEHVIDDEEASWLVSAIATALREAEAIAQAAEREHATSAVIAEAYWRHQGATPDTNTQSPEQIYAQNEAFERRCLLYMVGELDEIEPLTEIQWNEIKRRAAAIRSTTDE